MLCNLHGRDKLSIARSRERDKKIINLQYIMKDKRKKSLYMIVYWSKNVEVEVCTISDIIKVDLCMPN